MYLIPTHTNEKRQSYGGVTSSIADVGNAAKKASTNFTSSMSKGEIVGIVIAIFVVIIIAIGSIWWCCVRSAKKRDAAKEEEEKKRMREISNNTTATTTTMSPSMSAFDDDNSSPRQAQYWQKDPYRTQRGESDAESIEDDWSHEPLQIMDNRRIGVQEQYGTAMGSEQDPLARHDHQQPQHYTEPEYHHKSQIYTSSPQYQ